MRMNISPLAVPAAAPSLRSPQPAPAAAPERFYTVAEYLDVETRTGERHQYFNGKIKPMAGGSIPHNRIAQNFAQHLGNALDLKDERYDVFGSDQKIHLPAYGFYVYPDAVVVADGPVLSDQVTNAIINPLLIIEVLSDSTEAYDRKGKFEEYRSLPSFREYVLVRQDRAEATAYFREQPGLWPEQKFEGLDSSVYFKSLDVWLPMSLIYRKVEFGN